MNVAKSLPKQWPTVACVALIVGAYARAPFGGFVWDDVHLILRDPRLQSWSSFVDVVGSSFWSGSPLTTNEFYSAVYRPVVSAAYLVQIQFFGANAVGFHIVNIVLHILCTVLCIRWIAQRIPSAPPLALFFGGMLFAVHPSRVETVGWISGCVDLWMVFWLLLGLEAWQARRSVVAGVLFALALFSKEVAVMVPLLLLTDCVLLRRGSRIWKPWLISTGIITAAFASRIWLVPLAAAPRSYDAASNEIFAPWAIALGVAALACVAVLALLTWRHREKYRPWLADSLWFFVPLLPTLNILDIDAVARASDRFLYWPLMGVCALAARSITQAVPRSVSLRRVVVGVAAEVSVLTEGYQAADRKRYQWTAVRFALCQLETSLDLATSDDLETVVYVRCGAAIWGGARPVG